MELKLKAHHKYLNKTWKVAKIDFEEWKVTVYLAPEEQEKYNSKTDTMKLGNVILYLWMGELDENGEEVYKEVTFNQH